MASGSHTGSTYLSPVGRPRNIGQSKLPRRTQGKGLGFITPHWVLLCLAVFECFCECLCVCFCACLSVCVNACLCLSVYSMYLCLSVCLCERGEDVSYLQVADYAVPLWALQATGGSGGQFGGSTNEEVSC